MDYVRLDPARLEPARKPEAVAAGFEGQCNPRDLFTGPGRLIAPAMQQAIAGASLARRAVNLPLSGLKPGCGSRALCGSKLWSGVKNARPKSRNRKFESISLQRRVSCEPKLPRSEPGLHRLGLPLLREVPAMAPDRVLDDLRREAKAAVAERSHADILSDRPLAPDR